MWESEQVQIGDIPAMTKHCISFIEWLAKKSFPTMFVMRQRTISQGQVSHNGDPGPFVVATPKEWKTSLPKRLTCVENNSKPKGHMVSGASVFRFISLFLSRIYFNNSVIHFLCIWPSCNINGCMIWNITCLIKKQVLVNFILTSIILKLQLYEHCFL